MNLERRHKASSYAKIFLEEQTQQVRANLEDSERRLVAYARDREIRNLDDKLEILVARLKDMSSELIEAGQYVSWRRPDTRRCGKRDRQEPPPGS